jgi:hypothetical protein
MLDTHNHLIDPIQSPRAKIKVDPAAVLGEGGKGLGPALREMRKAKVGAR